MFFREEDPGKMPILLLWITLHSLDSWIKWGYEKKDTRRQRSRGLEEVGRNGMDVIKLHCICA